MICECDNSMQNTGLPSCVSSITEAVEAFLVPLVDTAGLANKIAVGAVVDNAFMLLRLNDSDPSQRWYPLKDIKNVQTGTPGEAVYKEWDDRTKGKVADGVRSAEFTHANKSPKFLGILESFECSAMGVFYRTRSGRIRGYKADETGDLYPISIQQGSMSSMETDATSSDFYNIVTRFDWSFDMQGSNVREWKNTVNWASPLLIGRLDVTMELVGTPNVNYFDAKFYHTHGEINLKEPITGLITSVFSLAEVTPTPGAVSFTAAETATEGTYRFTFAAPTTIADVLQLTGTKNGFDFATIEDVVITIA